MRKILKYKKTIQLAIVLVLGLGSLQSCKSFLPDDMDAMGEDVYYTKTIFEPIVGRNIFYDNVTNIGQNTSKPLTFKIVNMRDVDGMPVSVFNEKFPVKVWTKNYDGEEESIAEIKEKRKIEYRPIFEILEHSGNFNYWGVGHSGFIKVQPDSGYVFDVEIANSGGRKYIRDLKLRPIREVPYEPINMNPISGVITTPYVRPAYVWNMYGDRTNNGMSSGDVQVYFRKLEDNKEDNKILKISFLDSVGNTIDPYKFSDTNWDKLLHGFNRRIDNGKVVYDVAYPIPLANVKTDYTILGGNMAKLEFAYKRMNDFGIVQRAVLGFNFSIHEEGNWEIQFRFPNESPAFE